MSEYFAGLEALPLILQRNYTLMRDLDKSLQVLLQQNGQRCEQEIEDIRRGVMSDNVAPDASLMRFSDEALDEQKHCIRIADEKVALAIRAYDAVDEQIQQLDKYLKKFDEQSRKEKDVITAVEMKAFSGEGNIKSTRVAEIKKGGRRKIQATVPVEQPSIDLELPVDPNEPTYCICNQVSYGEMVACDNPNCKIEWFHYGCVGLKEQPRGKWYCPNCVGSPKRRKGK